MEKITLTYDLARSILRKDFISPEEIEEARSVIYTDEQLIKLGDTLPTQEMLEWCCDNDMMLVAGPPKAMSLLDIRVINASYFYSKKDGWYTNKTEKFSRDDKVETVWIALRKEPVAGSFNKNWSKQNDLVTAPMVVPNAAETVWGLTTYKAVRNVYLFPDCYVRTSSRGSDGIPRGSDCIPRGSDCIQVDIGRFGAKGLIVSSNWYDPGIGNLGVASARKF